MFIYKNSDEETQFVSESEKVKIRDAMRRSGTTKIIQSVLYRPCHSWITKYQSIIMSQFLKANPTS